MEHLVSALAASGRHTVVQDWTAIGDRKPSATVANVTTRALGQRMPKMHLLNDSLVRHDLDDFDYVWTLDDDIELPPSFIEDFVYIIEELDFALAQPARTPRSYIDFSIIRQQPRLVARQTQFVESGPLLSIRRDAVSEVLPFIAEAPMGWGLEYVWARRLIDRGLRMGVVDATPVRHTLRRTAASYDGRVAHAEQRAVLAAYPSLGFDEAHQVLEVYPEPGRSATEFAHLLTAHWGRRNPYPVKLQDRAAAYLYRHGWRSLMLRALKPWSWFRSPKS
jgi:hypothetical protein